MTAECTITLGLSRRLAGLKFILYTSWLPEGEASSRSPHHDIKLNTRSKTFCTGTCVRHLAACRLVGAPHSRGSTTCPWAALSCPRTQSGTTPPRSLGCRTPPSLRSSRAGSNSRPAPTGQARLLRSPRLLPTAATPDLSQASYHPRSKRPNRCAKPGHVKSHLLPDETKVLNMFPSMQHASIRIELQAVVLCTGSSGNVTL